MASFSPSHITFLSECPGTAASESQEAREGICPRAQEDERLVLRHAPWAGRFRWILSVFLPGAPLPVKNESARPRSKGAWGAGILWKKKEVLVIISRGSLVRIPGFIFPKADGAPLCTSLRLGGAECWPFMKHSDETCMMGPGVRDTPHGVQVGCGHRPHLTSQGRPR